MLWTFFDKFSLTSHQMDLFVWSDLLSLGRALIDRTRAGRYATIIHRKVRLNKPSTWNRGLGMLDFKIWPILLSWRQVHVYMRRVTRLKQLDPLFFLLQCKRRSIGLILADSEFVTLILLWYNRCSIGSILVYGCMISLEKERSALSTYLGSKGHDQRCNVNLIMRRILSRIILL